jgi:hypothetical protein
VLMATKLRKRQHRICDFSTSTHLTRLLFLRPRLLTFLYAISFSLAMFLPFLPPLPITSHCNPLHIILFFILLCLSPPVFFFFTLFFLIIILQLLIAFSVSRPTKFCVQRVNINNSFPRQSSGGFRLYSRQQCSSTAIRVLVLLQVHGAEFNDRHSLFCSAGCHFQEYHMKILLRDFKA